MFVLPTHMCGVEVVLVDVVVVVVDVDVEEVVEVDDEDVDEVVLVEVLDVVVDVDVLEVLVLSHPLQVLAQCVMLATRLSHNPFILKAMHWPGDSVSFFPSHRCVEVVGKVKASNVNVDVDAVLVVVSHPLQVLSHPPGATRVLHKLCIKTDWHCPRGSVLLLSLQRSVVVVVLKALAVVVLVVVAVVEVLVLVLVEVVYVVVLVVELVDVDVVVVVVSQALHVLSH